MDSHTDFFVSLLTERQFRLVNTRLTSEASSPALDSFIDALQKETNEQNLVNLLHFIPTKLTGQQDRETMINLILSTFEKPFLSIEQTLRIIGALQHNTMSKNKQLGNLLQFLADLLQLKIHSSPRVLLEQLKRDSSDERSLQQVTTMLEATNGKYATAEWKRSMTELVLYLTPRNDQISTLAEQSTMLQGASFQKQLQSSVEKSSDKQPDQTNTRKSRTDATGLDEGRLCLDTTRVSSEPSNTAIS